MTIPIRPTNGGFLRPFGCAWFIIEFLKGNGPEDSKKIDPSAGAPMTDVHSEYKLALHRAIARDATERAEEKHIARGKPAFTAEEYQLLLEHYLSRIPYKLTKCRYHSFQRYFHWLKQLGWVEFTGKEEPSSVQEVMPDYDDAPPRKYYRLTRKGKEAPDYEWSNPQLTLYPERGRDYFREKRRNHNYSRLKPTKSRKT